MAFCIRVLVSKYYILNLFDNKIYTIDTKVNGLKIISKLEFQSNVFDDVRSKFVSAHCIVTLNVLTVTDEIHKRCIFPIFRGLMEKAASFEQKKSWRHTCCNTQSRFLWSRGRHVWSLVRKTRSSEVFFLLGFPWVIGIVIRPFQFFFKFPWCFGWFAVVWDQLYFFDAFPRHENLLSWIESFRLFKMKTIWSWIYLVF